MLRTGWSWYGIGIGFRVHRRHADGTLITLSKAGTRGVIEAKGYCLRVSPNAISTLHHPSRLQPRLLFYYQRACPALGISPPAEEPEKWVRRPRTHPPPGTTRKKAPTEKEG